MKLTSERGLIPFFMTAKHCPTMSTRINKGVEFIVFVTRNKNGLPANITTKIVIDLANLAFMGGFQADFFRASC